MHAQLSPMPIAASCTQARSAARNRFVLELSPSLNSAFSIEVTVFSRFVPRRETLNASYMKDKYRCAINSLRLIRHGLALVDASAGWDARSFDCDMVAQFYPADLPRSSSRPPSLRTRRREHDDQIFEPPGGSRSFSDRGSTSSAVVRSRA